MIKLLLFIYFILFPSLSRAQSLVDDVSLPTQEESQQDLFTETIKIISNSKKIFILSNDNKRLGVGDFISLAFNDKLAARALVAKIHEEKVGIKILKIYSVSTWSLLKPGIPVKIVQGDDSYFNIKKAAPEASEEQGSKIKSEEDLYTSDVVVDDDLGDFDENKNRHIRPDNLVGISGSFYDAAQVPSRGGTQRSNEIGVSWAFQFVDNYFIEGLYGRAILDNYPADGTQTLVNHLTARLKYNIKGPLYTYFMPYLGFHSRTVSSPDAGKSVDPQLNTEELALIDSLKVSGMIIGISAYRRLVPGWFIKGDLGTDIVSLGFAIEF